MKWFVPALVGMVLLSYPLHSTAEPAHATRRLSMRGVEVEYHRGDVALAREAGVTVQTMSDRIADDLGLSFNRSVRIRLARGREEFVEACGSAMPPWAMAAALPQQDAIIVNAALEAPATANDLHLVVAHETVHLALARIEGGRPDRLPLWFHEGLATWLSEQRHVRSGVNTFHLAAAQGELIPFDQLERAFPELASRASLAYLQSEAFISHLVGAHSRESLTWIIYAYRDGQPFDKAFEQALGVSRRAVEKKWAASLRKRFSWLRLLWELTTLFGVLAVVTIVVYAIVRFRSAKQRRAWLEEEQLWSVVDDEEDSDSESDSFDPDRDSL